MSRSSSATPKRNQSTGLWEFVVDLGPGPDAKGMWRERRQARRRGFKTKAAAQEALDELRVSSRTGTHVPLSGETVASWLASWLEAIAMQVKPSTADFYRRYANYHVIPRIGAVKLQQLDAPMLNRLYSELLKSGRKDGKGLSVATVRHVHVLLGRALDAAVKANRIVINPARSAEPPSARSVEKREMTTWTAAEVGQFLDLEADTRYGPPFAFLALTGCRRGEALGLTWADVDLAAQLVSIRRTITSIDGKIHRSASTKTGAGRTIHLQPELVATLRAWRARQAQERLVMGAGYSDEDLVFCLPDGRPYHPDHFSREFDRRTTRHGMRKIRLHDLRHTYATLALAAGVPAKVVAERLGHSSVMVTLDLYSHVMPAVEADHADVVARMISDARRPAL